MNKQMQRRSVWGSIGVLRNKKHHVEFETNYSEDKVNVMEVSELRYVL
jgi:hypothetical protein